MVVGFCLVDCSVEKMYNDLIESLEFSSLKRPD